MKSRRSVVFLVGFIGNEAVFTVTNANATIPINLKGLGRGTFSIFL